MNRLPGKIWADGSDRHGRCSHGLEDLKQLTQVWGPCFAGIPAVVKLNEILLDPGQDLEGYRKLFIYPVKIA